jgi:hypothetical protein
LFYLKFGWTFCTYKKCNLNLSLHISSEALYQLVMHCLCVSTVKRFGFEYIWDIKDQTPVTGADPGFQVRGGALKKIAPSGGRCEKFWGISCEKSRFYDKKNRIFSNCGGRRENFWGISCEKSRFYAKKSYFFQF